MLICNYKNCDSWGICPHSKPHDENEECKGYSCSSQGQCAECVEINPNSGAEHGEAPNDQVEPEGASK